MRPHPILEEHGSFEHVKLGRAPVKHDARNLLAANYVDFDAVLPHVPDVFDNHSKVRSWPMYGNDRLGDCTLAALGHMIQAWTAAVGRPATPDEQQVIAAYWLTGHPPATTGQPGGPTDDGRVELDVLNWWHSIGLTVGTTDDRPLAYISVGARNHAHVKAAMYLFGGLYTGIALPISAQRQHVWDVVPGPDSAPGSWGGHAVPDEGYDPNGIVVVTWGALMRMTWAFHDRYVEEVYAILSPDWLEASGESIQGFDLAALKTDLAALHHR